MFWQYPERAPAIFALYGKTPEFQLALRREGHQRLVPIIAKCLEGGDDFIAAVSTLDRYIDSILRINVAVAQNATLADRAKALADALQRYTPPSPRPQKPEECGWHVVVRTVELGPDFLGRFDIDYEHGIARRLPASTIAASLKEIFTSGLQQIERREVRGETPTPREWGMAALDAGTFFLAGKSLMLGLKAKALAGSGIAAKAAVAGGVKQFVFASLPKIAAYGTIIGTGYLAVTHPSVITSAAATFAQTLGLNPWLVECVVWTVIIFVMLMALRFLLWPLIMTANAVRFVFGSRRKDA